MSKVYGLTISQTFALRKIHTTSQIYKIIRDNQKRKSIKKPKKQTMCNNLAYSIAIFAGRNNKRE